MKIISDKVHKLPVRKKLKLAIVGIGVFVLIFASAIMTFVAVQDKKQSIVTSLSLTSRIIGDNSVMAIVQNEPDLVSEKLLGLLSDESIRKGCAYDQNFNLFAEYAMHWSGEKGCPKEFDISLVSQTHKTLELDKELLKSFDAPIHTFHGNNLRVMYPIIAGGDVVGLMYLVSDLSNVNALITQQAYSTIAIIILTVILILLLTIWLQKLIAGPIVRFAETVEDIAKTNNFSARAKKETNDEFGVLADAFNHMLDVIQCREKELKDSELQALAAKEEAERANAVKSEFLSNMSHELRTPMNSIMGVTDILIADKSLNKDQMELLQLISGSSSNMLETITETLDMAELGANAINLDKNPFDPQEVMDSVVNIQASTARKKGVEFRYNDNTSNTPLIGDAERLKQILTNVIGNAIKFTEQGSVSVTFDNKPLPSGEIEFRCEVTDTGIGIPDNKLDYIFEKFTQCDETINRKYGGTGIGLAISKELVELMGGQIRVSSQLGEGSCFSLSIPFERSSNAPQELPAENAIEENQDASEPAERLPVEEVFVLVAEDDKFNQKFIERLLQRLNVKAYDFAENGQIAVDLWKENTYHMILMDCHMPEKNGYEATREIRSLEQEMGKTPVPIISITADVTASVEAEYEEAGMDQYVSKPVVEDVLREVLSQWLILQDKPT